MANDLLKSTANNAWNLVKFSHITGMTMWFFCEALYSFLVPTQYDYGGKFRHCINVCVHMYAPACRKYVFVCVRVHRDAHMNRMYRVTQKNGNF